ncbi:MAG: hypothetical protein KGY66_04345 [Candidatus Thermoplasmatota archaeon]|nr:hypothetical protein [Candidatus Thermoplasmatota archaeon]
MENADVRGILSNFLLSDTKRKIALSSISVIGVLLIMLSYFEGQGSYQFIMGLGVSLLVGTLIGFYMGTKIGWPLGFWVGLIGGLIVAPLAALLLGDSVSAYYASFLGPVVGALVGKWTELDDKRRLMEDMDKITK